jgi:uncharacterized protein (TIGR02145 family)
MFIFKFKILNKVLTYLNCMLNKKLKRARLLKFLLVIFSFFQINALPQSEILIRSKTNGMIFILPTKEKDRTSSLNSEKDHSYLIGCSYPLEQYSRLMPRLDLFKAEMNLISSANCYSMYQQENSQKQEPTVYTTIFDPITNGFKFDNNWQNYGILEQFGLCGGMVFTALDYFNAGCILSHFDRPPSNTALYQHIWSRQFPLSVTFVPQAMTRELFIQALTNFFGTENTVQNNTEYSKIKNKIVSGQPVPIGLIGETGQLINSHVVLGYGLTEYVGSIQKAAHIKVYDPNRPLVTFSEIKILWNLQNGKLESITLTDYQTKWVQLCLISYQPHEPPEPCEKMKAEKPQDVKDVDGNLYKTIRIDSQIWMAENLKVTHYRNGDPIPNVVDPTAWSILTTGAYCNYNNNEANALTYGRLYNYYTVIDPRNLCPIGWHVPSKKEYDVLLYNLGSVGENAYNQLIPSGNSGFSCIFSGVLTKGLNYRFLDKGAFLCISTMYDANYVWYLNVSKDLNAANFSYANREDGLSIRCIKE